MLVGCNVDMRNKLPLEVIEAKVYKTIESQTRITGSCRYVVLGRRYNRQLLSYDKDLADLLSEWEKQGLVVNIEDHTGARRVLPKAAWDAMSDAEKAELQDVGKQIAKAKHVNPNEEIGPGKLRLRAIERGNTNFERVEMIEDERKFSWDSALDLTAKPEQEA